MGWPTHLFPQLVSFSAVWWILSQPILETQWLHVSTPPSPVLDADWSLSRWRWCVSVYLSFRRCETVLNRWKDDRILKEQQTQKGKSESKEQQREKKGKELDEEEGSKRLVDCWHDWVPDLLGGWQIGWLNDWLTKLIIFFLFNSFPPSWFDWVHGWMGLAGWLSQVDF